MPISPIPGKGGTPPPEPANQQTANALRENIKSFIKETEDFLISPNLADNEQALRQYAETVIKLNELSNQALGE